MIYGTVVNGKAFVIDPVNVEDMYVVPEGKVFFLCGATLSTETSNNRHIALINICDAQSSIGTSGSIMKITLPDATVAAPAVGHMSLTPTIPLKVNFGQKINCYVISTGETSRTQANIVGYEIDLAFIQNII